MNGTARSLDSRAKMSRKRPTMSVLRNALREMTHSVQPLDATNRDRETPATAAHGPW
jgi:hypothetical protein